MAGIAQRLAVAGLLALGVGIGGPARAEAQAGLLGPGAGYVAAGVSHVATGDLDDRLAARGYPTFGPAAGALSLGAYRILDGGLMLGGEWHGLIMGEQPHEGREVGLGGGYATVGVGYAFELSPRVRVYPRLGLGAGGMGLWIEEEAEVAFDDVLADPQPVPGRQPVLSRAGAVVDLGGGAELLPGGWASGLLLGVRFGYLATPFNTSWLLYDDEASGGPASSIAGPYLRFVVGAAWSR